MEHPSAVHHSAESSAHGGALYSLFRVLFKPSPLTGADLRGHRQLALLNGWIRVQHCQQGALPVTQAP